jgi:hypothetical protein
MSSSADINVIELGRSRIADYVTVIVEAWIGERTDPATEVTRYAAMYRAEEAPEHLPLKEKWSGIELDRDDPHLLWKEVETVQKADREWIRARDIHLSMENPEQYRYGSAARMGELYREFLDAIDTLAIDKDNEEAWNKVQEFRQYQALKNEK